MIFRLFPTSGSLSSGEINFLLCLVIEQFQQSHRRCLNLPCFIWIVRWRLLSCWRFPRRFLLLLLLHSTIVVRHRSGIIYTRASKVGSKISRHSVVESKRRSRHIHRSNWVHRKSSQDLFGCIGRFCKLKFIVLSYVSDLWLGIDLCSLHQQLITNFEKFLLILFVAAVMSVLLILSLPVFEV